MKSLQKTQYVTPPKPTTSGSFLEMVEKRKRQKSKALLLDTSGSMHSSTFLGGTRISALRAVVDDLPASLRRFAFSGECREVKEVPQPEGGTRLGSAFLHIKQQDVKHAILITDGEPTESHDFVLDSAKGLKVDIFYVGGEKDPPQILKDLAAQCNGSFDSVDLEQDQREITAAITLLLEDKSH